MRRCKLFVLLAAVPLIATQPLLAANVQVGTCLPHLKSYSTISAAVSAVPAESTVHVCPGTYAEQVTITKQLTLVGVAAGMANQAMIAVPAAGLLQSTTSMFGESVAAQVFVNSAGPVNITNIAVDGTGGDMNCLLWLAGIFYGSGSSGTVTRVRVSGQVDGTCGVGIWAENSAATSETVKIQQSSVYNVDSAGIFAGSGTAPSLSVSINNNAVNAGAAVADIDTDSVNGLVTGNDLANSTFGVYDLAGSSIGANTIMGVTNSGVFLGNGGTASGNRIWGASLGVLVGASGASVTGNRIMSSTTAGVELGCFAATVRGNLINDAPTGIDSAAGSLGSNTFANTATAVTNGCAVAVAAFRGLSSTSKATVVRKRADMSEWHTPATPFGTRTK